MTRQEFLDTVYSWNELLDFCYDENYDLEGLYDEDAKDDYFDNEMMEMARNESNWRDLLDRLQDIPCGYEWYVIDDYYGFRGADDDDFEAYKDEVLEWGDHEGIWEDEDDAEEPLTEDEDTDEDEDDGLMAEETITIGELFSSATIGYQKLQVAKAEEREETEALFNKMFA